MTVLAQKDGFFGVCKRDCRREAMSAAAFGLTFVILFCRCSLPATAPNELVDNRRMRLRVGRPGWDRVFVSLSSSMGNATSASPGNSAPGNAYLLVVRDLLFLRPGLLICFKDRASPCMIFKSIMSVLRRKFAAAIAKCLDVFRLLSALTRFLADLPLCFNLALRFIMTRFFSNAVFLRFFGGSVAFLVSPGAVATAGVAVVVVAVGVVFDAVAAVALLSRLPPNPTLTIGGGVEASGGGPD